MADTITNFAIKSINLCSGDNYISIVYKTSQDVHPKIVISGIGAVGNLHEITFDESTNWAFNYSKFTSSGFVVADLKLGYDVSFGDAIGDKIYVDYLNVSTSGYHNPLFNEGPTTALWAHDSNNLEFKVAEVFSSSEGWTYKQQPFIATALANEPGKPSFSSTLANGSTQSGPMTINATFQNQPSVFSAYFKRSSSETSTNFPDNDGAYLLIDDGGTIYKSRIFIPSGARSGEEFRASVSATPTAGTYLNIGVVYSGNSHGESFDLQWSKQKMEVAVDNSYPLKDSPSVYKFTDASTIDYYEVRTSLDHANGTAEIRNAAVEHGVNPSVQVCNFDSYNRNNCVAIYHNNFDQVSMLKNNTIPLSISGRTINNPIQVRPNAIYELSFRYKTEDLKTNGAGGAGILYGVEEWTDLNQFSQTRILESGISSISNWDKKKKIYTQNTGVKYVTPFILVSGCVGAIYIDDVKLFDKELDQRTRTHTTEALRPSLGLELSNDYNFIDNVFNEELGSTVWKNDYDDAFLTKNFEVKKTPQWNFIWRQHLWLSPSSQAYWAPNFDTYKDKITAAMVTSRRRDNWQSRGVTPGMSYEMWYAVNVRFHGAWYYVGFQDHAETIETIDYIDSVTFDEDYIYMLYHINNVLITFNGGPLFSEFRATPNRYYLIRVDGNNQVQVRLNDGCTRNIRRNDGDYFPLPVYPERNNATNIPQWATGRMTDHASATDSPAQTWKTQIYDIAADTVSAFIYYCGSLYWWDDQTTANNQTLYVSNFVGAIPKRFPGGQNIKNIELDSKKGAIEEQFGAIIWASGPQTLAPSGKHPGLVSAKRFVGITSTSEFFEDSDIPGLIIAESQGNGLTNINLKLLTHTAYTDILGLDFSEAGYANGFKEIETNYISGSETVIDIMQIQNLELPQMMYNGATNWPSGATITPFHLSYNRKSKMLYAHTKEVFNEFAKTYVFKTFNQWSFENRKYYDNDTTTPTQASITYKYLDINTSNNAEFEVYDHRVLQKHYSDTNRRLPFLAYYNPQSDYMVTIDSDTIIESGSNESRNINAKTLFRASYAVDGQNIVSKHADGTKGFRKQTEYYNEALFKEPLIVARTSVGDEYRLSSTPLTSGTFNNIKITKDYTIDVLSGELWLNMFPASSAFVVEELVGTHTPDSSVFAIASGATPSGVYDDSLLASYSNHYTIPKCWAQEESIVDFLGKIAEADAAVATIDQQNNIVYRPINYFENTRLSNGHQGVNHKNLVIPNLGLNIKENLGNVNNPIFDATQQFSEEPSGWDIYSVGSGTVSTSSDISKLSRRAAAIISSGYNFLGKITSSPIKVRGDKTYNVNYFYNSTKSDKNIKFNMFKNNMLTSGSTDGWVVTANSSEFSTFNIDKQQYSLKISGGSSFSLKPDTVIPVDIFETYKLTATAKTVAGTNELRLEILNVDSAGNTIGSSSASAVSVTTTGFTAYELNYTPSTLSATTFAPSPKFILPVVSSNIALGEYFIGNIILSGSKGNGNIFNIYEYDSNDTLLIATTTQLREDTHGFLRNAVRHTTKTSTDYIVLEFALKNTIGSLLVDGVRVDSTTNPENFIVNDSLLRVSDAPQGATSFAQDYKQNVDYVYSVDRSVVSLLNDNKIQNGYFQDLEGAIPAGVLTMLTGIANIPTAYMDTGFGFSNDNSLNIKFSGDSSVKLFTKPIPIDSAKGYEFQFNYNIITGDVLGSDFNISDELAAFVEFEFYDEDMNLLETFEVAT